MAQAGFSSEAMGKSMARCHFQTDAAEQAPTLALVDPAVLVCTRNRMRPEVWTDLIQTVAADLRRFSAAVCKFRFDGDRERLRFAAHALRDVAVSFGAPQLAGQAGMLEKSALVQSSDRLIAIAAQVGDCARSTALEMAALHMVEAHRLLSKSDESIYWHGRLEQS